MKSPMRFQAATCSGLYMPVQPGLIRPSRLTSVISVITSPAPPIARLPRWTRCQSFGVPSSAEYWHMGEQTTRLASTSSRSRKGVNIGGGAGVAGTVTRLCASALDANQRSTDSTNFGSRTFRFAWVTRRLRVRRPIANWIGSRRPGERSVCSKHSRLTCAPRWRLPSPRRRPSADAASAFPPRAPPRRLRRLEDERGHRRVVPVRVDPPEAVVLLLEDERERGVRERGAEPDELVPSPVDVWPEVLGVAAPHDAVDAVGGEHEVGVRPGAEVADLGLPAEPHAELRAAALQNIEQELPRQAREAVAGGGQHLPPVVDVDVVPVGEVPRDLRVRLGVGVGKGLERRVGEDHAEPERVVAPVALDDEDVVGRIRLLHEQGEVEPGRPAADTDDLHVAILGQPLGRASSWVSSAKGLNSLANHRSEDTFGCTLLRTFPI